MAVEIAATPRKFDCLACPWGRHCDASNPAPDKQWLVENSGRSLEFDICIKPMVSDESRALLALYPHFENSLMPRAGGLLEQSQAFLTAMEIVARARIDAMKGKPDGAG